MATTLIIKNSSTAGKVPDPSALQAGELGVNLKDQKLYSKDVDGNVFELGRGSTASGGSGEKPGSPVVGDLYYDTDLDVLLVWNGGEWETVGSVTSVNGETGEVVLTAADVGALAPGDDISELNNDKGYLTAADLPDDTLWLQGTGAIYPKTLSDNVQVGGTDADPNIELNAEGKLIIGEIGSSANKGPGAIIGNIGDQCRAFFYSNTLAEPAIAIYSASDSSTPKTQVATISNNGNAVFQGDVAIGDKNTFRDNAAIIAALPEEIRETFKSALSKWEKATPYVPEDPSTLPADETLREAIIRVTTAGKINLNADGSATFGSDTETARIGGDGSAKFSNSITGNGTFRIHSGSSGGVLNLDGGAAKNGGEINLRGGDSGGFIQLRTGEGSGQQAERMRIDGPTGNVLIGGALPLAPNISLGAAGYGLFKNSAGYQTVISAGSKSSFAIQDNSSAELFRVRYTGQVEIGGTLGDADQPNIDLNPDGSATFNGKLTAADYDLEALPALP